MFRLSKKLLFAIEAVVDIAYNAGDQTVQSGDITERQGIPRRYLEQVLQQLVRAEILSGVRGPHGGYRLARERRRITLADIVRVVRAMDTTSDPLTEQAGSDLGHKVVRPLWQALQDESIERLSQVTIDDLCQRAQNLGIARDTNKDIDFSI